MYNDHPRDPKIEAVVGRCSEVIYVKKKVFFRGFKHSNGSRDDKIHDLKLR